MNSQITHIYRDEILLAGLREPANSRDELPERMAAVEAACSDKAIGPLVHIIRFDTPVEGFDSEIGYFVEDAIEAEGITTHRLRPMHFFSLRHHGPVASLRDPTRKLYEHMNLVGLAPELELMELYHRYDPNDESKNDIEVRASFLAWPEVYREQLDRVLGPELTEQIWAGGEAITPFTLVDERASWVAESLERLKAHTDQDQQFDILSRVALVRPIEDINKFKTLYTQLGDINQLIARQEANLAELTPSRRFVDPPYYDGKVLHQSKVPYRPEAYEEANTDEQRRRAYCFCPLVREAEIPQIDPIFCYRAAGWARQFWEPILGVEFTRCTITHSILKGDPFCAWDYEMPAEFNQQSP
jgi:hypothetical protein